MPIIFQVVSSSSAVSNEPTLRNTDQSLSASSNLAMMTHDTLISQQYVKINPISTSTAHHCNQRALPTCKQIVLIPFLMSLSSLDQFLSIFCRSIVAAYCRIVLFSDVLRVTVLSYIAISTAYLVAEKPCYHVIMSRIF